MSQPKIFLKGPDGRIVQAPRANTMDVVVDGAPVIILNEKSLKPGWVQATDADVAKLAKTNAAAQKGG